MVPGSSSPANGVLPDFEYAPWQRRKGKSDYGGAERDYRAGDGTIAGDTGTGGKGLYDYGRIVEPHVMAARRVLPFGCRIFVGGRSGGYGNL